MRMIYNEQNTPVSRECIDSTVECVNDFFAVKIIKFVAGRIHEPLQFVRTDDQQGILTNGTYSGMFSLVQNGSFDMIPQLYTVTQEKMNHFIMSTPLGYQEPVLLIRRRLNHAHFQSARTLIDVFKSDMWMGVLTSLFALLACMLVAHRFRLTETPWLSSIDVTWKIFEQVLRQNTGLHNRQHRPSRSSMLITLSIISYWSLTLYENYLLGLAVVPPTVQEQVYVLEEVIELLQTEYGYYVAQHLIASNCSITYVDAKRLLSRTSAFQVVQQCRHDLTKAKPVIGNPLPLGAFHGAIMLLVMGAIVSTFGIIAELCHQDAHVEPLSFIV